MRAPTTKEPTIESTLEAFKTALFAKIAVLRAKPGDVVIVKPAGEAHHKWSNDASNAIAEVLGRHLGEAGLLLIIPPGADIEFADDAMMEKHGWVRAVEPTQGRDG